MRSSMIEMRYKHITECKVLCWGEEDGCRYAIVSLGTHPVAYVECKIPELKRCDDKRLEGVDVHGGFTYIGGAYWWDDDERVYLGWDYAHYMDYSGFEGMLPEKLRTGGKRWTVEEIYDEVLSVIKGLKEIEK